MIDMFVDWFWSYSSIAFCGVLFVLSFAWWCSRRHRIPVPSGNQAEARQERLYPLVHLTTKEAEIQINEDQEFVSPDGGPIYALRLSIYRRCRWDWELMIVSGLPPSCLKSAIAVPGQLPTLFFLFPRKGIYGSLKCIFGNYWALFCVLPFDYPKSPAVPCKRIHTGYARTLNWLVALLSAAVVLSKICELSLRYFHAH